MISQHWHYIQLVLLTTIILLSSYHVFNPTPLILDVEKHLLQNVSTMYHKLNPIVDNYKSFIHQLSREHFSRRSIISPTIYHFLPHLILNNGSTLDINPQLVVQSENRRSNVDLVFGIPCVKREEHMYLITTLQSMFDGMTPSEANQTLIVVMIADVEAEDAKFVSEVITRIRSTFNQHIKSGLLEVFVPSRNFYPNLDDLPLSLGDPAERVKWRSKQNLDYSYLIMYCFGRGSFYVQMEDDVISKKGFVSTIYQFALAKRSDWFYLSFCKLGFIGKLFRNSDLLRLSQMMVMFYMNQPVDWLLDVTLSAVGSTEKKRKVVSLKFSLFQHIGKTSSLKGKVQRLIDDTFKAT